MTECSNDGMRNARSDRTCLTTLTFRHSDIRIPHFSMPYLYNTTKTSGRCSPRLARRVDRRAVRADSRRAEAWRGRSNLPPALSEMELDQHLRQLAAVNQHAGQKVCFLGGGSYDHFVPAVCDVDRLAERVLHLLHAVPGRGEPGQPAGDVRVPVAHHAADGHGRGQLEPVRRRERRGRGGADGAARRRQSQRRSSRRRACTPSIGRRSPRIWRISTPKW